MDLDLRLVRAFVAVADQASFSRAADSLFVSQPALSQQVRQLERVLGVQLFERTSRRVELTAAGALFIGDARHLLDEADRTVMWLRRVARPGRLVRVGFVPGTPTSLMIELLHLGDADVTATAIELASVDWDRQALSLRERLVDLAFVQLPLDCDDLMLEPLAEVGRVLVCPINHPLATEVSVSIDALADTPILDARYNRDFWLVLPRPGGAAPPIVPALAGSVDEMLTLVAARKGIAITAATVAETHRRADLAYVPISDIAPVTYAIACLETMTSDGPARRLFDAARQRLPTTSPPQARQPTKSVVARSRNSSTPIDFTMSPPCCDH